MQVFELSSRRNANGNGIPAELDSEEQAELDLPQTSSLPQPDASQDGGALVNAWLSDSSSSREGSPENMPGPAEVTQSGARILPVSTWLSKLLPWG
eukprot:jgi/Botrbrau1/4989/Bobra.0396s0015.1